MFGRLLRVLIGFAVACFGAGLTLVLFVLTPSELSSLPPDVASDRLGKALELAVAVAVQAALFGAPLAIVAAAVGESLKNRELTFYALAGLLVAALGFFAQHSTEQAGQPTIVNNYALTAFLTAGFVAGLLYWLFSGRLAGGREAVTGGALVPAGAGAGLGSGSGSAARDTKAEAAAPGAKPSETAGGTAASKKP